MTIKIKHCKKKKLKFPEHDKVQALNGKHNVIGKFIDWLKIKYTLATYVDNECYDCSDVMPEILIPAWVNTNDLIAEYFEIDLEALENERCTLFKALKNSNNIN